MRHENVVRPAPWTPPATTPDGLVTDRLVLRRYVETDAEALNHAVSISRDSLQPWLPWALTNHRSMAETICDIVNFSRQAKDLANQDLVVLGVFLRGTGELVGGSGFHTIRRATHQAEIGYWTNVPFRRRGYCAEATRWMVSWMLTPQERQLDGADGVGVGGWGFRRVEILCAGGNSASAGVPRSLGLCEEQHRRQDRWVEPLGWQDTLAWGVLQSEWDTLTHRVSDRHSLPGPNKKGVSS